MSRFNDIATLRNVTFVMNEDGDQVKTYSDVDVFVNRYKVGTSTWIAAQSNGLHADAQIQMRKCDFNGATRIVMDEIEYEVERVSGDGEFVVITLERKLSNV